MSRTADTLIVNTTVLLPDGDVLLDGAVAVVDGVIEAVGPTTALDASFVGTTTIDGRLSILGPGLVDAHTHLALSYARALPPMDGHPVYDVFWPLEQSIDADLVFAFARVAAAEALLAGVTTVADHYFFAAATAAATTDVGLRSLIGQTILRLEGPQASARSLDDAVDFAQQHMSVPLVHPAIAPHGLDTVGDEWMVEAAGVAAAMGIPIHIHVAQSEREMDIVASRSGCSPISQLERLGVLDQRTIAAHCMYATDDDLEILASHPLVHPIYCPTVHAAFGKVMAASKLHELGSPIGLGTDAAPSERFDVLAEARAAWGHQAVLSGDRESLPLDTWLSIATEANAVALGLGDEVGRIEVGFAADFVMWRIDRAVAAGMGDARRFIAAIAGPDVVDGVWVAGRQVVRGGAIVSANEGEIVKAANDARSELFSRANFT